jgi:hypothetical protein
MGENWNHITKWQTDSKSYLFLKLIMNITKGQLFQISNQTENIKEKIPKLIITNKLAYKC